MKSKTVIVAAVAGLAFSTGAFALGGDHMSTTSGSELPMSANETTPSTGTVNSLDTRTGGYKGWGPMANLQTPYSVNESAPARYTEEMREHQQQLAEVRQVREQVWVANAPLRSEYENIGSTRSQAGGFGSFFHRGSK
jgi:hypothetical protein